MNTDLMLEVADAIELYPDNFYMAGYWLRDARVDGSVTGTPAECGTTGCIAGWAATLDGYRHTADAYSVNNGIRNYATTALGLTPLQACEMFESASWVNKSHNNIVSDLRGIAKGELVWSDDADRFVATEKANGNS